MIQDDHVLSYWIEKSSFMKKVLFDVDSVAIEGLLPFDAVAVLLSFFVNSG